MSSPTSAVATSAVVRPFRVVMRPLSRQKRARVPPSVRRGACRGVVGGDPLIAHCAEVRSTRAPSARQAPEKDHRQPQAQAKRQNEHEWNPRIRTKRNETGWKRRGVLCQHFDELGGWCRPKSSGKDLNNSTLRWSGSPPGLRARPRQSTVKIGFTQLE